MSDETPAKHPGGRPSKYNPAFCDKVIELGKAGKSVAYMATELDVCKDTVYQWAKDHPEFSDALTRASLWSQRWWEDKGQDGMEQQGFNASIWSRSMAARFPADWREVKGTELTGKDGGPVAVQAQSAEWMIVDPEAASGA